MPSLFGILGGQCIGVPSNPESRNARIIMDTIESAIHFHSFGDERLYFDGFGDVSFDEDRCTALLRDHMDGLLSPVFIHIRNDEFRSLPSKGQGCGSPNP